VETPCFVIVHKDDQTPIALGVSVLESVASAESRMGDCWGDLMKTGYERIEGVFTRADSKSCGNCRHRRFQHKDAHMMDLSVCLGCRRNPGRRDQWVPEEGESE